MAWAGDRHLTNILARWVDTERCSSSANCNFSFQQSFSARQGDNDFGLAFDGLHTRDSAGRILHTRSFASSSGYCNPEYTDAMMLDCVNRCMDALLEGDHTQSPVRNIMFIPYQKGQIVYHTIATLARERQHDIRPLVIFPPKTYPFWQLGYWFGRNKLSKLLDLCYNDGPVALIVFDNARARAENPFPTKLLDELAIWRASKLPTKHADQIQWLNEFAPAAHRHPPRSECRDYKTLIERVTSWISHPNTTLDHHMQHFTVADIANTSPPSWLVDNLLIGGLSATDAALTAMTITQMFRTACITNWQSRNINNASDTTVNSPPEFDLTPARVVTHWGQPTPGSKNARQPNPSTAAPAPTPPPTQTHVNIRTKEARPPLNLVDPPRYNYDKTDLPAKLFCTLEKRLARKHKHKLVRQSTTDRRFTHTHTGSRPAITVYHDMPQRPRNQR